MTDTSIEGQLLLVNVLLEAIELVLDGKEPSDFELSFPIVRRVADLYEMHQTEVRENRELWEEIQKLKGAE